MLGIKPFWKRENTPSVADTSALIKSDASDDGWFSLLVGGKGTNPIVSPQAAYRYFAEVPALATAVDLIAWAFLQIPPVLRNKETNELLHKSDSHPLLNLLENPGRVTTGDTLKYEMMVAFLLTNEIYPVAVGNTKYAPSVLYHIEPSDMTPVDGSDGWVGQLQSTAHNKNLVFSRDIKANPNMWTFVDKSNTEQTIQISSNRLTGSFRGASPLNAIFKNMNLINNGLEHNVNLLQNGGRPSGVFAPTNELSERSYKNFLRQIANMFTGYSNAGRIIASPSPITYENFITSNRDMDFARLLEQSRNEVFSRYGIPLPYISEKVMTMSNFSEASTAVYDSAVLPRARTIYKQLGAFLLARYKDGDKYELSINEAKLPALQDRLAQRLKTMTESHVFTINEERGVTGLGSVEGGDTIYQPGNLFPIGTDTNPQDILGG